ncbi:glycosyltransferase [Candidatus Thiothrix anitrata]|uniref:Glycosyltransferase n=1 Tax=Candidatus Thiothrix anitrata TaxID=2823902 RepID=A0ABX7X8Y8_9GAMM|nr:glycosyltransferase [Candidatus Thiothrix anitrata]QTR51690.1 glycosyltransferase [Candidatus Thiothrix anitrata]
MPFSIALAKMIGFNRFSFIYHCQDIHPEAMQAAGRSGIFDFFLQKLEKFSLKNADKIITLSEEMKDTLHHKTSNKNIFVADNYIPHVSSRSKKKKSKTSEVKLIYAGNIGIFQNLELLVDILLNEEISNTSLTIIGEGASKKHISKMINNHKNQNKIKLLPSVTSKEIGEIIANHDFGVVSLIPTMSLYASPSKINTYLAEGIPIICISDKNTELEKIIHKEKIGAYCYTNDKSNIINTLRNLSQLKNELDEDNIYSYYLKSNSREKLLANLFKTITS